MTTNRLCVCAAITTSVLALTGCATRDASAPGAMADPVPRVNYPNISILDELVPYVVVSEPIVTKGPDQPLRVTVPIRAITRPRELNTQYRFIFFDADGRPIEPQQAWQYERLPSRAQRFFEANALDQRAVDWRLEVRPAR
ncbi:MAG: DUF1425 domain-containing protein [Phycisphaeraceae bacterium]|nr:DUF1425 domain-containing protein [Phycisphaeraceae bacterium]